MDSGLFWSLLERSRVAADVRKVEGSLDRQAAALRAALEELSGADILVFRDHFHERLRESFRWDLWGAAYLLGNGCSDDAFMDFRNWLISMGRATFEDAVTEPDSLARFVGDESIEDFFFEGLQAVPVVAYRQVSGREAPVKRVAPTSPSGARWDDASELERLLPRVWTSTTRLRDRW